MSQKRVQRKLTSIFVADVVGYSRLMHKDEEATLAMLESCREAITVLIARHGGRIFNTGGDSVLAEFPSAVEAVRCAVALQGDIAARNAGKGDDRALTFRIGINIGDVMIRDGDLFGDGVNIAARLEGLAEPGGICISAAVFEQVRNKVACGFEDLGPQSVKNIAGPVSVYRIVTPGAPAPARRRGRSISGKMPVLAVLAALAAGFLVLGGLVLWQVQNPRVETASVQRMALPLPNRPSIAVLPFTSLGMDPRQELLSDGVARDIITDLSAFADLMVIAGASSFSYKGRSPRIGQVAEELGVRFVLDGSVQAVGQDVRINVQLIDAISGSQLWAKRYDREFTDIFAIQDEITQNVVAMLGAIEGPIALADRSRTRSKQQTDLTAYEYVLLARDARNLWTGEGNARSLELVQKAIERDPQYARAYVEQAWTYFQDVTRYRSMPARQAAQNALASALKAIELDETFAEGYWVAGDIYAWLLKQPEKSLASYDRALALNPNHADILAAWGGWILPTVLNRPQEGIEVMQKAMRLSPFHEDWFNWGLMNAYFMAGEFEQAVTAFQSIKHPSTGFYLRLAASYAYLGRVPEAQGVAARILAKKPEFSVEQYFVTSGSYRSYRDRMRAGLLKAGLPE